MSGDRILEESIISIKEDKQLIGKLNIPANDGANYEYICIVTDRKRKHFVRGFWGETKDELEGWQGFVKDFYEYKQWAKPKTIYDCMVFDSVFVKSRVYGFSLSSIYDIGFELDPVVDAMLSDSKGYLLWKYQLKNLLGIFTYDNRIPETQAEQLHLASLIGEDTMFERKEALKETKNMRFSADLSLYDVIKQRSVGNKKYFSTGNPQWREGYSLYNVLRHSI